MALLYIAKRNCEELIAWAESVGKTWSELFPAKGQYALNPNTPFDVRVFADLSDQVLQEYADGVCNAFSRHKASRGMTFRYSPQSTGVMSEEQLMKVLKRDRPSAEDQEHSKRQALLLSDIAGFD